MSRIEKSLRTFAKHGLRLVAPLVVMTSSVLSVAMTSSVASAATLNGLTIGINAVSPDYTPSGFTGNIFNYNTTTDNGRFTIEVQAHTPGNALPGGYVSVWDYYNGTRTLVCTIGSDYRYDWTGVIYGADPYRYYKCNVNNPAPTNATTGAHHYYAQFTDPCGNSCQSYYSNDQTYTDAIGYVLQSTFPWTAVDNSQYYGCNSSSCSYYGQSLKVYGYLTSQLTVPTGTINILLNGQAVSDGNGGTLCQGLTLSDYSNAVEWDYTGGAYCTIPYTDLPASGTHYEFSVQYVEDNTQAAGSMGDALHVVNDNISYTANESVNGGNYNVGPWWQYVVKYPVVVTGNDQTHAYGWYGQDNYNFTISNDYNNFQTAADNSTVLGPLFTNSSDFPNFSSLVTGDANYSAPSCTSPYGYFDYAHPRTWGINCTGGSASDFTFATHNSGTLTITKAATNVPVSGAPYAISPTGYNYWTTIPGGAYNCYNNYSNAKFCVDNAFINWGTNTNDAPYQQYYGVGAYNFSDLFRLGNQGWPASSGQDVTYYAFVAGTSSSPSGTVAFYSNGQLIYGCSAQPLFGAGYYGYGYSGYWNDANSTGFSVAECTVSNPAVNTVGNTITARYSGDTDYLTSSTGNPLNQKIFPAATVTLTSSQNPALSETALNGNTVTYTASVLGTVVDPYGNVLAPTGTVTFYLNHIEIPGCVGLSLSNTNNSGEATATCQQAVALLAYGAQANAISVSYSGDWQYVTAQTSSPLYQVIVDYLPQAPIVVTNSSTLHLSDYLLVAYTGGSGTGAVTISVANGTATGCNYDAGSNKVTASTTGTCVLTVAKASDALYASTSTDFTINVVKGTQSTLRVVNQSTNYGTTILVSTSGGSGSGSVTLSVANGTASGCVLNGTILSATSAGTCLVTATKAGDATYASATSAAQALTFSPLTQSAITLATTSTGINARNLQLAINGGSGTGAVSYYLVQGGTATGCSLSNGILSWSSAGTCIVSVSKAADSIYSSAQAGPFTVTITPAAVVPVNQATLTVTASKTTTTKGASVTLTARGGSGTGAVSYVKVSGTCSLTGRTLKNTRAGVCTVKATKAASTGYNAATSAVIRVTFR